MVSLSFEFNNIQIQTYSLTVEMGVCTKQEIADTRKIHGL